MTSVIKANSTKNIGTYFLLLIILLFSYRTALFTEYGLGDDFDILNYYLVNGTTSDLFISNLRPIYGLLSDLPLKLVSANLSKFYQLKLIYLALISLACFLSYRVFIRLGIKKTHGFYLVLLIGLSPASQAMISYGVASLMPLGLIASILSFSCMQFGFKSSSLLKKSIWFMLAGLLTITSISIYTSYALFIWVFVLTEFIISFRQDIKFDLYKRLIAYLSMFAVSSLAYLAFSYCVIDYYSIDHVTGRASITSNILISFINFLIRPFRDSINLLFLSYYGPLDMAHLKNNIASYLSAVIILSLTMIAHWKWNKTRGITDKDKLLYFVCCFALICLCYLSHLVLNMSFYPYRTQFALFSAMLVFIYFGSYYACKNQAAVLTKALLLFSLLGVLLVNNHMQFMIKPVASEWTYVKGKIAEAIEVGNKDLFVLMPTDDMKRLKQTYYDDFGMLISMFQDNKIESMIFMALHYKKQNYNDYKIHIRDNYNSHAENQNKTTTIDMRKFYM